ncbi:DegT/DnrJ/EryC1/StrS aminotransferase family protein [Sphaerotilus hippei]|uniref:DegT/DnrJ/EryC1/StrS aminotransferase family protein n=2 Tax=Sphaerotilus hippei TaxID=744406 RepID=A0A318H1K8_9BURK|nr:DegT/DnrJ/EryC1/StrS aminotransferase family protein [Sphaerotilus hippei]
MSAFSFHETKNVISGEGGLLAINQPQYANRAEIIREKGTNRSSFFRGEVDKYGWVDIGSSFLPSDIVSAYLFAQLETLDEIQARRKAIWQRYWDRLAPVLPEFDVHLPFLPEFATNNAHMFYLVCRDLAQRTKLIAALKAQGIHAVFHYLSLHDSPYFQRKHDGRPLPNSDRFSNCLVRLPMFYELGDSDVDYVCNSILSHLSAS